MAEPFPITNPAEREAFLTEREKFRRENLARVRASLTDHVIVRKGPDGKVEELKTGFKVMGAKGALSYVPDRSHVSADLSRDQQDIPPEYMAEVTEAILDAESTRELAKDVSAIAKHSKVDFSVIVHEPGPSVDTRSEEALLDSLEDHVRAKGGELHPHLSDSDSDKEENEHDDI